VIASQAVRVAPMRRAVHPRLRHTTKGTRAAARSNTRRAGTTWELRTFVAVSGAIALVFVLAMLYLAQTTTVSARGYEAQRLEQTLAEVRRQNALLEVENARLDAPARIDTEARKIGLVRAASIPVVQLEAIQATTVRR
jgi:cell division protein FtsL